MADPVGVTRREVTCGPFSTFESGEDLGVNITFQSTVPELVWAATGQPVVALKMQVQADTGGSASAFLIPTDLNGWLINGEAVIVDATHASHAYNVTVQPVEVVNGVRTAVGAQITYRNVVVPSGDGPIDLDEVLTYSGLTGQTVGLPNLTGPKGDPGDTTGAAQLGNVSGTLDLSGFTASSTVTVTLTGNVTQITLPNPGNSKSYTISVVFVQDATGSRTVAFTGETAAYGVAPVLSTAAGAVDLVHFFWDGTRWWVLVGAQAGAVLA